MENSRIKTELKQIASFTARNIKLFFRDKGALFGAMISPLIILMLYALFLHRVFVTTFDGGLKAFSIDAKVLDGLVASYEVSSVLAVCCVTVAFVANMCMVSDRVTGARADFIVAPVRQYVLVLGYYFATAIVALAICYIATAVGFCYIAGMGWTMTFGETAAVMLDVLLGVMFGTALSSIVCCFLRSQGAISAVSTIVGSVYGFVCGAYYPIAQFSKSIANVVMCFPGTYCTGLFRSHFMGGYTDVLVEQGVPEQMANAVLGSVDVKLDFFGTDVKVYAMYAVVAVTIVTLVAAFVLINILKNKRRSD